MAAVRDAAIARDARAAWQIAARALGEALADPELAEGSTTVVYDGFEDYDVLRTVTREEIEIGGSESQEPVIKEFFVVRVRVRMPGELDEEFAVEAHVPAPEKSNAGP
jgi:hypothetical protein